MLKLNSVSTMADIKKIRQIYDQVEIHVRGLQAQGVDSAQYGKLLIPIMMAKIPEDLRLILSRQFCGDNWNLDELLRAFKTELEARERCASSSVGTSSPSNQVHSSLSKWKGEEAERNPTAAALASFNRKINCTYCHKSHPSVRCNVITDVKALILASQTREVFYLSQEITHCTRLPKHNEMFQMPRAKSSRKRLQTRFHYARKYRRRSKDNFLWEQKHCTVY